jgi:hypothetical protein
MKISLYCPFKMIPEAVFTVVMNWDYKNDLRRHYNPNFLLIKGPPGETNQLSQS